ncbi:MAG: hypothetical protein R2789_08900 [Microthrixaceae bacterium]
MTGGGGFLGQAALAGLEARGARQVSAPRAARWTCAHRSDGSRSSPTRAPT